MRSRLFGVVQIATSLAAAQAAAQTVAPLTYTLDSNGLSSLQLGGVELLFNAFVGGFNHDGVDLTLVDAAGGATDFTYVQPTSKVRVGDSFRQTYAWGTVTGAWARGTGDRMLLTVTVTNSSASTITTIGGHAFVFAEPGPPLVQDQYGTQPLNAYPRYLDPRRGVPAITIGFGTVGALLFAVEGDPRRSLYFGRFWGYNGPDRFGVRWQLADPIAPGATSTARFSVAPVALDATRAGVSQRIARPYAGVFPQTAARWTDRRFIGREFLANIVPQPPTNPRGYLRSDPTIDVTTPAGLENFRTRMLQEADGLIDGLRWTNGQGVVVWDIEGAQDPNTTYVCDPTKAYETAPELAYRGEDGLTVAEAFFKRIRDAGFKVGVCIRPQVYRRAGDGWEQVDVADPASVIDEKIDWAVRNWGASIFYVDSNANNIYGAPIPVRFLFDKALARHPDVLILPEWQDEAHYARTAPYLDFTDGATETPLSVRAEAYPGAFSALSVGARDGSSVEASFDAYLAGVRRGDILMANIWYRDENADLARRVYLAAGARPSVTLTADAATIGLGQRARLTAAAADADGRIARVEFWSGGTRLRSDTSAPYTFDFSTRTAGPQSFVARALDLQGNSAWSAPAVVDVRP